MRKSSQEEKPKKESPKTSIIDHLESRRKELGFKGEIRTHHGKDLFRSGKDDHYYILTNNRKRIIECISCKIRHGGVLEAHLLTRYKLNGGVLSLDGKEINKAPKDFICPEELSDNKI